jgi:hypothetical protein
MHGFRGRLQGRAQGADLGQALVGLGIRGQPLRRRPISWGDAGVEPDKRLRACGLTPYRWPELWARKAPLSAMPVIHSSPGKEPVLPRRPEEVRKRLDELISRCDVFLPPQERAAENGTREPRRFSAPKSELWRFLISSLQTVASACGRDSPHLRELERCREEFASVTTFGEGRLDLDSCRGALEAARDDLDAGMLTDLRQLVTAEAFGDLLETAVHLWRRSIISPLSPSQGRSWNPA